MGALGDELNLFFIRTDAWQVAILLGVAMLVVWGLGLALGGRLRAHGVENASSPTEQASLALLGLLLAFTFGMSISKHDTRREAAVHDSNSIGDFYTCVRLLKEPARGRLSDKVREYTALRLSLTRPIRTETEMQQGLSKVEALQSDMTDLVSQAINEGTPIAVPLTQTLNGLTSSHASRVAAVRDRLPASIVILLFIAALACAFLLGREQSIEGHIEVSATLALIAIVAAAVWVTLDLNQPYRGMIRVSEEPMQRLYASMGPAPSAAPSPSH